MKNCLRFAALVAMTVACGCTSTSQLLDGISRTSSSNDTFNELFWDAIRRFPANHDERQCAVYGTNEWLRVESYPDGTPCRAVRGGVIINGRPDDITTSEIEYDFCGNVVSSYSLYGRPLVKVAPLDFEKCCYWRGSRRVIHGKSVLSLDYSYDMYYYQESASRLKIGIWTIDRKNHVMDKLVLTVPLVDGRATRNVETDSHLGGHLTLRNVIVDDGGCIRMDFILKANEKTVDLEDVIGPALSDRVRCCL